MTQALPDVLVDLPVWDADLGPDEISALEGLEGRLSYSFQRRELLRVALTVGSWANENREAGWPSNACLEFFGDAVLDLVAAHALWRRFPTLAEGALTRLRAALVREGALAPAAEQMGIGACLWVGRGDEPEARSRAGTLADAFEAVLGAVYLDARAAGRDPIQATEVVFALCFGDRVMSMTPEEGIDPKSRLQQLVQSRHKRTPTYSQVGDPPPPHDPHWCVRVEVELVGGELWTLGEGEGRSLREAERAAARAALASWGDDDAHVDAG